MDPAPQPPVYLLPEWHHRLLHSRESPQECYRIKAFGSFFDVASWRLGRKLASWYGLAPTPLLENDRYPAAGVPVYPYSLIFMPISTEPRANRQLQARFLAYLEIKDDATAEKFMVQSLQIVSVGLHRRFLAISHKLQAHPHFVSRAKHSLRQRASLRKCPVYLENKYLFGAITARYLESIRLFPYVEVEDLFFNGIPLGDSIEAFFERLVATASPSPLSTEPEA